MVIFKFNNFLIFSSKLKKKIKYKNLFKIIHVNKEILEY